MACVPTFANMRFACLLRFLCFPYLINSSVLLSLKQKYAGKQYGLEFCLFCMRQPGTAAALVGDNRRSGAWENERTRQTPNRQKPYHMGCSGLLICFLEHDVNEMLFT